MNKKFFCYLVLSLFILPWVAEASFLENIHIPWSKLYAAFLSPLLSFIGFVVYGKIVHHRIHLSIIGTLFVFILEALIIGVFFYSFLQIVAIGLISLLTFVTLIFFIFYILIFSAANVLFFRIITKRY